MEVGEVATTAERARRAVVARDPLLVEVARAPGDGRHRSAPRQTVRRAVDVEVVGARSLGDAECRGEPGAVHGVIGDDRVARPLGRPRPRRRVGDSGKQAGFPGRSRVARGGVADGHRAALEDAPDLEDRDDRRAERERVGLHLRGVLTDRVARAVARDLPRDHFAVTRDGVAGIGSDDVAAGAAADRVAEVVAVGGDAIVAGAGVDDVAPGSAEDDVGACEARDRVFARTAVENVGSRRSREYVAGGRAP